MLVRLVRRALLFALALLAVLPARGAVSLTPTNPTAADLIFATIDVPGGCTIGSSTIVTGSLVRTDVAITGCIVGPPPVPVTEVVNFGPLPAGSYTYRVYFSEEGGPPVLEAELPLVIAPAAAPAPVPTVSTIALTMLAALLALVALPLLRR